MFKYILVNLMVFVVMVAQSEVGYKEDGFSEAFVKGFTSDKLKYT